MLKLRSWPLAGRLLLVTLVLATASCAGSWARQDSAVLVPMLNMGPVPEKTYHGIKEIVLMQPLEWAQIRKKALRPFCDMRGGAPVRDDGVLGRIQMHLRKFAEGRDAVVKKELDDRRRGVPPTVSASLNLASDSRAKYLLVDTLDVSCGPGAAFKINGQSYPYELGYFWEGSRNATQVALFMGLSLSAGTVVSVRLWPNQVDAPGARTWLAAEPRRYFPPNLDDPIVHLVESSIGYDSFEALLLVKGAAASPTPEGIYLMTPTPQDLGLDYTGVGRFRVEP
jgi:hypothetical protein